MEHRSFSLTPHERATLEGVARRHEVVFDGEVLDTLKELGLVTLSDDVWTATPAGLATLQDR